MFQILIVISKNEYFLFVAEFSNRIETKQIWNM